MFRINFTEGFYVSNAPLNSEHNCLFFTAAVANYWCHWNDFEKYFASAGDSNYVDNDEIALDATDWKWISRAMLVSIDLSECSTNWKCLVRSITIYSLGSPTFILCYEFAYCCT